MPVEETKSVSAAINEITDESLGTTDAGEDGEETAEVEATATSEENVETTEEEGAEADEETEEEEVEEEEVEEDGIDIFDGALTPEQQQAINENPDLKQLRKALLKGYEAKTTELKQLIQLGEAWKSNPRKVVEALAQTLNLTIAEANAVAQAAGAAATSQQQQQQADPLDEAGKELESLFGKDLGPRVRGVFEKWADARIGKRIESEVTPIKGTLGRVVNTNEQSRMLSEEATFKQRKGKELSPVVEARIVALGNSGKYIPGKGMTPQEYLDSLYDLATAQISRERAKKATGTAAKQLARKIESNRKDTEPAGRSGRGGSVKPVSKVSEARSISEALDIAEAELQAEGL